MVSNSERSPSIARAVRAAPRTVLKVPSSSLYPRRTRSRKTGMTDAPAASARRATASTRCHSARMARQRRFGSASLRCGSTMVRCPLLPCHHICQTARSLLVNVLLSIGGLGSILVSISWTKILGSSPVSPRLRQCLQLSVRIKDISIDAVSGVAANPSFQIACRFSRTCVPSSSSLSSCNAALSPSLASAACAAPSGLSIGRSGLDNLRSAGTTKSPYRAAISSTTAGCFVVASWTETVATSPSSVTHFCARSVPLEHPSDTTKTAVTDRRAQNMCGHLPRTSVFLLISYDDMPERGNADYCSSWKLKAWKPKRFLVKCQGVATARLGSKLGDQSIGKCSASLFERHHGREHFLLILYPQDFDLKYALDCGGDFLVCQAVSAVQNPYGFGHGHDAHKTRMRRT